MAVVPMTQGMWQTYSTRGIWQGLGTPPPPPVTPGWMARAARRYLRGESFGVRYWLDASDLQLWLDQSDPRGYGDGANWYDLSGKGNHAAQAAGGSQPDIAGTAGLSGACRDFDGADDKMALGDELDVTTEDFTLIAWVRHDGQPAALEGVVTKRSTVGYGMYVNTNGRIQSTIQDAGGAITSTDDGTDLTDNAWHQVAVVFDRDGNMSRYLDGLIDGSADGISGANLTITNADDFVIGDDDSGNSYFWEGQIACVMMFGKALNIGEIRQIYMVDKPRYGGL